jgi:hypothetical protein
MLKSEDMLLFESKVTIFKEKWKKHVSFINCVEKHLFPLIYNKVCLPVWENKAPCKWTNNNAESSNHVLKRAANWKLHQLPELIDVLYNVIKLQQVELERAMLDTGNFQLAPAYEHFKISMIDWVKLSTPQRKRKRDNFLCKSQEYMYFFRWVTDHPYQ